MENEFIKVWKFNEAPLSFQELSDNGGDEDWLALVPASMVDDYARWLECPAFGCCCVDRHVLPNGNVVVIGAHA